MIGMRGREFNATRTDVINVNLRFIVAKSLISDLCLGLCRTIRSLYSIEFFFSNPPDVSQDFFWVERLNQHPQKTLHYTP